MESIMRMIRAASLLAVGAMLACAPPRGEYLRSFKGNYTGGIIA
jgi:hypothetical protein